MNVDIDKEQYPHLSIEDIEKSVVIQNSDVIDGFEITTNHPRLDNTCDFFLWDGVIVKKEWVQPELNEDEKNTNERSSMSIQEINRIKTHYPAGTRIELISMSDPFDPVPSGMRGTVDHVDDQGQMHMHWDNLPISLLHGLHEGKGIWVSVELDEETKFAEIDEIDSWYYPKQNKIAKTTIKEIKGIINSYFAELGYTTRFISDD